MIIWIVATVLLLVCVPLLLTLAVAMIVVAMELMVRVVLAVGLAVLIGCAAGLVASQWGHDGFIAGAFGFMLALVPALVSVWRWRSASAVKPRHRAIVRVVSKAKSPAKIPVERELGLTDEVRLSAAWDTASRLASGTVLDQSRTSCARFLANFEAEADCDPRNVDLAVFIRRQVPALIDDTQAVLHNASPEEREETIAALVAALEQLGQEAAAVSERRSAHAMERLDLRRNHFARRKAMHGDWA